MATIRRVGTASGSSRKQQQQVPSIVWIFIVLFVVVVFLAVLPNSNTNTTTVKPVADDVDSSKQVVGGTTANSSSVKTKFQNAMQQKRNELFHALESLTTTVGSSRLPHRLRTLRDRHEIIGERLSEVASGTETVEEILHGHASIHRHAAFQQNHAVAAGMLLTGGGGGAGSVGGGSGGDGSFKNSDKPPMELDEIIHYLDTWIHELHEVLMQAKHATFEGIWQAFHDLAVKTLFPWDLEYLERMPPRRTDGSVFLSVATYRDENCFNTVYNAYKKAKNPEKLFVGLVQQNCHKDCKSGVLANLSMVPVPPDDDCYQLFCESDIAKDLHICDNHQVRVLNIDEPESLGPYAARYFTSKLWYGESWFMQTDAHMTFAQHWDATSVSMLQKAPSEKPILSHYPPGHTVDLETRIGQPASRLCGPVFATSDLENQIIRLEGGGVWDKQAIEYPAFAPFTAAGYFVAHSDFLREVPFDPFLPWIFMGTYDVLLCMSCLACWFACCLVWIRLVVVPHHSPVFILPLPRIPIVDTHARTHTHTRIR
jgi:[Skp1-protein]-hydroxyproline N-acetylglucosaminyltransferase